MQEKIALSRRFHIRLSDEELETIKEKATAAGLSVSAYFRTVAMRRPIVSVQDKKAIDELLHIAADLGRLGGLLKHWLTKEGSDIGEGVERSDIVQLFKDLEQTRQVFRNYIKQGGATMKKSIEGGEPIDRDDHPE